MRCSFGPGKGLLDLKCSVQMKPAPKLAGGYCTGDHVESKIDFEAQSLKVGDIGKILGPYPNDKLDDQKDRVRCDFGPGKGLLDMKPPTQIKPATSLAGGYFVGDRIASKIDFEGQNLKVGDIGTILEACPNTKLDDQHKRVRVEFGPGKGLVDLVAAGDVQLRPA